MPPKNFEEYTVVCGIGNEEKITYVATSEDRDEGIYTLTTNNENNFCTIPISDWSTSITIGTTSFCEPRPLRLHCEYCGCVSSKDYGTCEHCGAPLVPLEYIY